MSSISISEYQEWAQHPVTKAFLVQLAEREQETLTAWANEAYTGQRLDQGALMNAKALGGLAVVQGLIEQITSLAQLGVRL